MLISYFQVIYRLFIGLTPKYKDSEQVMLNDCIKKIIKSIIKKGEKPNYFITF